MHAMFHKRIGITLIDSYYRHQAIDEIRALALAREVKCFVQSVKKLFFFSRSVKSILTLGSLTAMTYCLSPLKNSLHDLIEQLELCVTSLPAQCSWL